MPLIFMLREGKERFSGHATVPYRSSASEFVVDNLNLTDLPAEDQEAPERLTLDSLPEFDRHGTPTDGPPDGSRHYLAAGVTLGRSAPPEADPE